MKRLTGLLVIAVFFVLISVSIVPLAKMLINANFETKSVEDRERTYLLENYAALSAIDVPNFVISTAPDTLQKIFDVSVNAALDKLTDKKVGKLGTISIPKHTLKLKLNPMSMIVGGDIEIHIPDKGTVIETNLEIKVFTWLKDEKVVYIPAVSKIEVTKLEVESLLWWPWSLAMAANTALSVSLDAVNGAIKEQSYEIDTFARLRQEIEEKNLRVNVLGREIIVRPPRLGGISVLIDHNGIGILGEVNSVAPKTQYDGTTSEFDSFRDAFHERVQAAFSGFELGTDQAWISKSLLTRFVLDDAYKPASSEDVVRRVLSQTAGRLDRISDPTFLFAVGKEDLDNVIDHALADAVNKMGQPGDEVPVFVPGKPEVTLGEGILNVRVPFNYSFDDVIVSGEVQGIAGFVLTGNKMRISGAFSDVSFHDVVIDSKDADQWPYEEAVALIGSFANSTLPAINGFLADHPIVVPMNPLVTAGQPADPVMETFMGRKVHLKAPMVTEWAALVHPDGMLVVAAVEPYRSEARIPEDIPSADGLTYKQVAERFTDKVRGMDPQFKLGETGFRLADSFLRSWLKPIFSPVDVNSIHLAAITESHAQLFRIEGPDIAASVPTKTVENLARVKLEENRKEVEARGFEIDPAKVEFKFGTQVVSAKVPFVYNSKTLNIRGTVTGGVFVGADSLGIKYRPVLLDFELHDLVASANEGIDLNIFQSSLAIFSSALLPIINGALESAVVKVKQPKPFVIDFKDENDKKELTVKPEKFTLTSPAIHEPVILVAKDRIALIADMRADYLEARPLNQGGVTEALDIGVASNAFNSAFKERWVSKYAWQEKVDSIGADVSTARVSRILMQAWRLASLKADYRFSDSSKSDRKAVAAIPPKPSCKGGCSEPSCNRNKACPPRKACKDVTEIITTPVEVQEKVCKEISKTPLIGKLVKEVVCDTVTTIRNVQTKVTKRVCEEVADTACLATLNKCTADWKVYDLCALPFKSCTEFVRGVSTGLKAIDFDKFGYASTESNISGVVTISDTENLTVTPDLRRIEVVPRVSGSVTLNLEVDFEPRASILFGCAPVRPMELRNYKVDLNGNSPKIVADIEPAKDDMKDDDPDSLDLVAKFHDIEAHGQVKPAPLTKLVMDNPDLFLTCPLLSGTVPTLEILGNINVTRDAVVGVIREIAADKKTPPRIARLLLDGEIQHDLEVSATSFAIPPIQAEIGDTSVTLRPEIKESSLRYMEK